MNKTAHIIVAQTSLTALEEIANSLPSGSHNELHYLRIPIDVVNLVIKNQIDVVVTGSCFYETDISTLEDAASAYIAATLGADVSDRFRSPRGGDFSGGELAKAVHRINPRILVLRYSLTPYENPRKMGINGDIEKWNGASPIIALAQDKTLKGMLDNMHWQELIEKYKDSISFYNSPPGWS